MALSIGIVGLPNVGKSTVFNALCQAQNAEVANYPFCTIQPNRAIVPVPDTRLDKLAELVPHDTVTYATLEFVDIAGLVEGASRGEGLGNKFLAQIREAAAILHVVRCFDDPNVVHIRAQPEPRADIEIVNLELILADLQQLENRLEKLRRQAKGDRKLAAQLAVAEELKELLETGEPVSAYARPESADYQALNHELNFLSAKPVIYVANVDEDGLAEDNDYTREVRAYAAQQGGAYAAERGAAVVKLCAKLEEEMADLSDEERHEYLALAGVDESGLEQVIRLGYRTLGLISYFTTDSRMLRAWTIRDGWTAPQAAGVIHTDFEHGFIRAEVIHFDEFVKYGSEAEARHAGALRTEGRNYIVQDGDVIHFLFSS
jgi:ribosome-binding ATPase